MISKLDYTSFEILQASSRLLIPANSPGQNAHGAVIELELISEGKIEYFWHILH